MQGDRREILQEQRYLNGMCQECGKRILMENGEVIDTLIMLVKKEGGRAYNEYLGEWCSKECFYRTLAEYLGKGYPHSEKCYMLWREKPKGTGEASVILIPLDERAEKAIHRRNKELLDIFDSTTNSEETINFSVEDLDRE